MSGKFSQPTVLLLFTILFAFSMSTSYGQDEPVPSGWPTPETGVNSNTSEPVPSSWPTPPTTKKSDDNPQISDTSLATDTDVADASLATDTDVADASLATDTDVADASLATDTDKVINSSGEHPPTKATTDDSQVTNPPTNIKTHPKSVKKAALGGFTIARSNFFCAQSGIPLKGRYYKTFKGTPLSALSYSAEIIPFQRDSIHRLLFWDITSSIINKDYTKAVETAIENIEFKIVDDSTPPRLVTKTISMVATPGNISDKRRFKQALSRSIQKIDGNLTRKELNLLSTDKERPSLQSLLSKLPALAKTSADIDQNEFLKDDATKVLYPAETSAATLGQAVLLSRLLTDYLMDQVHKNQRYLKPVLQSEEAMLQEIISILRIKAAEGTSSVIEDNHLAKPFIANKTVSTGLRFILILLFIAMIPLTTYKIHRHTMDPAEKKRQEEARLAKEEEKKLKEAANAKTKEEADAKAKEETDAKAKEEADAKAKEEADAKAKEEADAKAKEEADTEAKEETDTKAKEETDTEAKEETEDNSKEKSEENSSKKDPND